MASSHTLILAGSPGKPRKRKVLSGGRAVAKQ